MSGVATSDLKELKADRKAPLRQCIVTRVSQEKDRLIRFVIGPDAQLVPDLAGKLPARGYWVSCDRATLEKAVKEKRFQKAAKSTVAVSDGLVEQTQQLLESRALDFLALANKAGQLIAGFDKVAEAKDLIALIHAADASADSMRKLASDLPRFTCFQGDALSAKLGLPNAVHLGLRDGKAGQAALKEIRRFTGFIGLTSL